MQARQESAYVTVLLPQGIGRGEGGRGVVAMDHPRSPSCVMLRVDKVPSVV